MLTPASWLINLSNTHIILIVSNNGCLVFSENMSDARLGILSRIPIMPKRSELYSFFNFVVIFLKLSLLSAHTQVKTVSTLCIFAPVCNKLQKELDKHWCLTSRDGRIVIIYRIPDSVNRRLISGRFRIRIFLCNFTTSLYLLKLQQIASDALFFSVIFNRQ